MEIVLLNKIMIILFHLKEEFQREIPNLVVIYALQSHRANTLLGMKERVTEKAVHLVCFEFWCCENFDNFFV